jgi:hypothetical protein
LLSFWSTIFARPRTGPIFTHSQTLDVGHVIA